MDLIIAFGYFTFLAGIFLAKLFPIWNIAIPGGLEDTRLFLWNAWWFHYAISVLHATPFYTSMLFHPFGASLISHDFPLWTNLITYIGQQQGLSMIASSNVWFALSWILAGFCTYGLVREVTRQSAAGIVAGTFVMTHSYVLARAMQNWGQFNIYGIPLFLWCLIRARRRGDTSSFILAGAALAWTAACHYYFLIYSLLIWLTVVVLDLSPYRAHFRKKSSSAHWLLGLAIIAGIAAAGIGLYPGIHHAAGFTISMKTPQNVLFVMWLLLMIWGTTHVKIELQKIVSGPISLRDHAIIGATAALFLSPLFWETFKLVIHGGYPKQSILWKTHLRGPDVFSLFMPNPLHALWGPTVSHWFTARGMEPQDQAGSIGWVCLAFVAWSQVWKENVVARRWLMLALAATVLAMGTHLHVAQYNLWCPLPFFWLRLFPIIGNVRVPERWMGVAAIGWSVVLAFALTKLAAKHGWPLRNLCIIVTTLILVENWPGIPFEATPPISSVYTTLRQLPEGAVFTIPLYIGDSSIGTGDALNSQFNFPWDHLWAQITHQKPILGGYIGRISRKLITDYKADPFIHTLLDLEERKIHSSPPEKAQALQAVQTFKFTYVLVYPESTDPEALKYVMESLPLELVDKDASTQLYRLTPKS